MQRDYTNNNTEFVSTSFNHGLLSTGEMMFFSSEEIKLEI